MTVATLIQGMWSDPAFSFEHYMAHSTYYGVMSPLYRFSVLPYMIDPMGDVNVMAGDWNLNHQQAHNDFLSTLPAYWYAQSAGIPMSQILVETNLNSPEEMQWWLFSNLVEHQAANNSILPGPILNRDWDWVYPFG